VIEGHTSSLALKFAQALRAKMEAMTGVKLDIPNRAVKRKKRA